MKIQRIKRIKIIAVTIIVSYFFTYSPAEAGTIYEERLDVPNFRQIWSPWGKEPLGSGKGLIENYGCALTSTAMVLKYYGVDTDPARLNRWLTDNEGYWDRDKIIWTKIGEYTNHAVNFIEMLEFRNGRADLKLINSQLDRGFPVIARVNYLGKSHYVVITGRNGSTYFINDPFWDDPSLTLNNLYQPYSNPSAAIKGVILYNGNLKEIRKAVVRRTPANPVSSFKHHEPVGRSSQAELVLQDGNSMMNVNSSFKTLDPSGDSRPVLYYNETMLVPASTLVNELGGKLMWQDRDRKLTLQHADVDFEMWIDCKTAYVNGMRTELEVSPKLIKERAMVPVRVIAEIAGWQLYWNGVFRSLRITT